MSPTIESMKKNIPTTDTRENTSTTMPHAV
jgi:hypothetical protein